MKFKPFVSVWLLSSLFLFISCLESTNETLVLPKVVYATPIEEVIPPSVLKQIEEQMPIYKGATPPTIEGVYLCSTDVLVYTSDGQYKPGDRFIDKLFKFSHQNGATNIVNYVSIEGKISRDSSAVVSVSGDNNHFTAYFISEGISKEIHSKRSTIISGTKTDKGISDYRMAFVMLEKSADPDSLLMNVNEFRVFKDSDGLASNVSWEIPSKIRASGRIVKKQTIELPVCVSGKIRAGKK